MKLKNIITSKKAIKACLLLKNNSKTRIPETEIDNLIKKLEKDSDLVTSESF